MSRRRFDEPGSHRSAGPSTVVALGVGAKGSLITTLVVTAGGHGRRAPLLVGIATLVVTPGGHGHGRRALRQPRQGVELGRLRTRPVDADGLARPARSRLLALARRCARGARTCPGKSTCIPALF